MQSVGRVAARGARHTLADMRAAASSAVCAIRAAGAQHSSRRPPYHTRIVRTAPFCLRTAPRAHNPLARQLAVTSLAAVRMALQARPRFYIPKHVGVFHSGTTNYHSHLSVKAVVCFFIIINQGGSATEILLRPFKPAVDNIGAQLDELGA